jgi:hypothetical protein
VFNLDNAFKRQRGGYSDSQTGQSANRGLKSTAKSAATKSVGPSVDAK